MLIALCPRSGAAQPGAPAVTLYGRGLAKLKKGDRDGGNADIAAAKQSAPTSPTTSPAMG
jgi:hypothetical protein